MDRRPPRVFISYADDSSTAVLELAQWLRNHGIDAHIDQFEDSPEEGWPRWIYTQIRESDFVLVACTRTYLERCEGQHPRALGAKKAVKFESHLSLQELHDADGRNRKFVPLLFGEGDVGECVPLPLRGATHYRLPAQREDLYRRLSAQPKVKPVPLGVLRTYDDDSLDSHDSLSPVVTPADSIEATVAGHGVPHEPRPASWRTGSRRRALTAGVFGVAFLVTVLFINHAINGGGDPGPGGGEGGGEGGRANCSIQLTDSSGNTVDDISRVSIELPAGHAISVIVEDGKTLMFECPTVAVNARVNIERDSMVESSDYAAHIESDITISPEPGLKQVQLAPPRAPERPEEGGSVLGSDGLGDGSVLGSEEPAAEGPGPGSDGNLAAEH